MAIYPTYGQRVRSTQQPGYRQRLQADPRDYGSDVAKGIEDLGEGGARLAQRVRDESDVAALQERQARLARETEALLSDPDHGFVNQRGEAALAGHDQAVKNWDTMAAEVGKDINPRIAARWQAILDNQRLGFVGSVDRHTAGESDALKKQALEGSIASSANAAAGAVMRGELDGAAVVEAAGKAQGAIDASAAAGGWDRGYAESQRKAAVTSVYLSAINAMMEQGQGSKAAALLAAHRSEMDEDALLKSGIDKHLRAAGLRERGQAIADSLVAESGGDALKALELFGKHEFTDTEERDEARTRLGQGLDDRRRAIDQHNREVMGGLRERLFSGERMTMKSKGVEDLVGADARGDFAQLLRARANRAGENGAQARRDQALRNRWFDNSFDSLDEMGDDGNDKLSIDVDTYARQFAAINGGPIDPDVIENVRAKQKKTIARHEKDGGVSAEEFTKLVDERVKNLSKTQADAYRKHANGWYTSWANQPENAGKTLPLKEAGERLDKWWTEGERAPEDGYLQPDMKAIDAEIQGVGFVTKDGKVHIPAAPKGAPTKAPAPADRRPRRTVNGETRVWNGSAWVKE